LSKFKVETLFGKIILGEGLFVSTIGLDEEMIQGYGNHQEKEERKIEGQQLRFEFSPSFVGTPKLISKKVWFFT